MKGLGLECVEILGFVVAGCVGSAGLRIWGLVQ